MNKLNQYRQSLAASNPGTHLNELVILDSIGHQGLAIACMANLTEVNTLLVDQSLNPLQMQNPAWQLVSNLPPIRLIGLDGTMRHVAFGNMIPNNFSNSMRLIIKQNTDGLYYLSEAINDYNSLNPQTCMRNHQYGGFRGDGMSPAYSQASQFYASPVTREDVRRTEVTEPKEDDILLATALLFKIKYPFGEGLSSMPEKVRLSDGSLLTFHLNTTFSITIAQHDLVKKEVIDDVVLNIRTDSLNKFAKSSALALLIFRALELFRGVDFDVDSIDAPANEVEANAAMENVEINSDTFTLSHLRGLTSYADMVRCYKWLSQTESKVRDSQYMSSEDESDGTQILFYHNATGGKFVIDGEVLYLENTAGEGTLVTKLDDAIKYLMPGTGNVSFAWYLEDLDEVLKGDCEPKDTFEVIPPEFNSSIDEGNIWGYFNYSVGGGDAECVSELRRKLLFYRKVDIEVTDGLNIEDPDCRDFGFVYDNLIYFGYMQNGVDRLAVFERDVIREKNDINLIGSKVRIYSGASANGIEPAEVKFALATPGVSESNLGRTIGSNKTNLKCLFGELAKYAEWVDNL